MLGLCPLELNKSHPLYLFTKGVIMNHVIVGDAGGTNVRFGVAEDGPNGVVISNFQKLITTG